MTIRINTMLIFCLGLAFTVFYDLLLRLLPAVYVITPTTQAPRHFFSIWLAIILSLYIMATEGMKPIKNKAILVLFAFLFLSIHLAPYYPIEINGVDSSNFWVWKTMFQFMCFFMMYCTFQGVHFSKEDSKKLILCLQTCAIILSVYACFQALGVEQFFAEKSEEIIGNPSEPNVVGVFGNATILGSFLVLLLPFLALFKKFKTGVIVLIAIFLTKSEVAIYTALFLSGIFFFLNKPSKKSILITLSTIVLIAGISVPILLKNKKDFLNVNGRVHVWKQVVKELSYQRHGLSGAPSAFTGVGPGSYAYITRHSKDLQWYRVHNEPLEVTYMLGYIGFGLFLLTLWFSVDVRHFFVSNPFYQACFLSFFSSLIMSLGTFVWQMSPHNLLCVFTFAMINNESLKRNKL